MHVVVMAAGQGKRMRSSRPKVLHTIAGRPMLAHVLDAARSIAPKAVAVVVGHGADEVERALAAPGLTFVRQDPPRGTGDAVRVALAALPRDGVTVVINGDTPLIPGPLLHALAEHASRGHLAVLTAHVADPSGLGRVVRDGAGSVRRIVEDRDASHAERAIDEIYTGVLAAPTALLAAWVAKLEPHNAQDEYYLTDVVAASVADGVAVDAVIARDERDTRGVNDRAQLADVERIVQRRLAETLMRAGATIADPARFDLRGTLACGSDVSIDIGCIFEGRVVLGDGVRVGPHCILRDCEIGAGSEVRPYSIVEGATIGANSWVGPYARLRPGTVLADEVHIGNFVEVKASTLGRGSKANHLAYVGDTTIGERVNFGAGAITANYDGANKNRTVIGDDASIGSNVLLVAPIEVGAGATIAGGSTISKDAPAGELTVARAKQTTVPGWKRPAKKPPAG
ncbi:MAG: bifunctional UDP-N-acetylglucosamine diphosphorylase/glucosamine-1-phosphate N-acetyltransferase GlmU [Betaproteobacteria bacterium]